MRPSTHSSVYNVVDAVTSTVYSVVMLIAVRDQEVPTTTVGKMITVTYLVEKHGDEYRLYTAYAHLPTSSNLLLMRGSKADVLSMGELTEGQGVWL